jgi:hypothetical protein
MIYTPTEENINTLARLAKEIHLNDCAIDSDYPRDHSKPYKIMVRLLMQGHTVELVDQGVKVNNTFLVAIRTPKWKRIGKGTWYWYKSLESIKDILRK